MLIGLLIFGVLAVIVVAAFIATSARRRAADESLPPEDRLTDEQFRRIEGMDDT